MSNIHVLEEAKCTAKPTELSRRRRLIYGSTALLLTFYTVFWVAVTYSFQTNIAAFAYYVIDYSQGFVRRGLAGEVLKLFPADLYFTNLLFLRWIVSGLFLGGLTAVAWTVAMRFGRSERRLMLAMLTTVLPFGFAHGVVLSSPDLLGGVVLAVFAVLLTVITTDRSILFVCISYGLITAVLALVHEAIPLLLSLGATAAVIALGASKSINVQRLSVFLCVAPGLAATTAIGLMSRRDVSPQCARLPHADFDFNFSMIQSASGRQTHVDFHDWVCSYIVGSFARTPADALGSLASQGLLPWTMSTVFGIIVLASTVFFIGRVSGVPVGRFAGVFQGRVSWIIFTAALLLPVFATAGDWGRWWVALSFDIGLVYLLYAAKQPESGQKPSRRSQAYFALGIFVFALFPCGTVAQIGLNHHVQTFDRT